MRLAVCLVFLASFALVCQGQGYHGGHTRPVPRPFYGGSSACTVCRILNTYEARSCCRQYRRCCTTGRGYRG
uniref:Penaeidin 3 n=1 Tax=Penaeus merguiensis TaxID=71412 RepID=A0A4D6NYU1_PENME|nr:penaeidin 3 [Penaeus merguiensis]QCE43598.1 penaeidin 3 [Penaeus merguiensis]